MVVDGDNKAFMQFCRWLYDENCYERSHHGQKPYGSFNAYFTKNKAWLNEEYGRRERNKADI